MLLRMYLRWAERNQLRDRRSPIAWKARARASNRSPSKSTARTPTACCKAKWACTGWCAFRPSTPTRAAIPRSLPSSFIRRSTTKSRSTSSPEDLRVDTFRASGAGGQHVNRTDSAIRMTHLPTGIVVQCQNERSQHKNRATRDEAASRQALRARAGQEAASRSASSKTPSSRINFGSQIRSYVLAPYRMIKDHRTKLAIGDVDRVLDGDLEALIHAYLVLLKTGKTALRCRA